MQLIGQISTKGTLKGYINITNLKAYGVLNMLPTYFKRVPATEPVYIEVVE